MANRYYSGVRELWDSLADLDMPVFEGVNIDADRAAWKQFGGLNNTDHPGYTYESIKTGHNKANLNLDDMWTQGIRNLGSDGLVKLAGQIVRNTARLTVEHSALADPTRPRYARVPSGSKTCAFCVMLASRGFAYSSEKTAGGEEEKYHDDCDCMIIPSWGRTSIKGYDPDRYMEMYRNAAERSGSTDSKRIAQWMRHTYPKELTDGVIPKKNRTSFTLESRFTGMKGERSLSKRAWDKRQKALGIPLDWDTLEMHEITFMETFKASGQHFEWIPKDEDTFKPTNDFHWIEKDLDIELKGTTSRTPKYHNLASIIRRTATDAHTAGVTKDSFMIDLRGANVTDKLLSQLSRYNSLNSLHIKHLFIYTDKGVQEIKLV